VVASEREEFLRAAWRVLVCAKRDGKRFVFVDECSTNTSLSPIYGWSRKGKRVCLEAPRKWEPTSHLALEHECGGDGRVHGGGGLDHESPLRDLRGASPSSPVLTPGQVVVMDNLSSHKGSRVRELCSRVEAASFCTCRPTPRRTIEPHRGSVRQDKGAAKEGRGTHPRGAHRSDGLGA
jgi:hypothetical protein